MPTRRTRTASTQPPTSRRRKSKSLSPDEQDKKLDQVVQTLSAISDRVNSSPVLNGGFDNLVKKIDNLGDAQEEQTKKLDVIHNAIYEPDEGLFARIKASDAANNTKVAAVEKDIAVLTTWQEDHDFHAMGKEDVVQKLVQTTKVLEQQATELSKWKSTTMSILKWVGGTIATSGAGLIVKVLYDMFS